MQKALLDRPIQYFDLPDDVVKVSVDPSTGLLAPDNAPNAVKALFKKGTEPKSSR